MCLTRTLVDGLNVRILVTPTGAKKSVRPPNFWDTYLHRNDLIYSDDIWYGNTRGEERDLWSQPRPSQGNGAQCSQNF